MLEDVLPTMRSLSPDPVDMAAAEKRYNNIQDVDLIEVLWKQDVDMGFSLQDPMQPEGPQATKVLGDEIDKELKRVQEKIQKKKEENEIEKVKASLLDTEIKKDDPWAGLSYTVDTETGEYVIQGELPRELVTNEESRFDLLEEALQLVELSDEADPKDEPVELLEARFSNCTSHFNVVHINAQSIPAHFTDMLASFKQNNIHAILSLMRSMSVEQRWQDLASLLTIPPPSEQYQHYHHHHHQHPHSISAHGAAGTGAAAPLEGAYKVESAHHPQQHDPLYYQNSTAEMAPPTNQDGFLQSILNDEDLQLMDMAMNEGMYTMRMLDGASAHHAPPHNHSHMMIPGSVGSQRTSNKPVVPPTTRPGVVKYECPEQTYHHDSIQHMHNEFGSRHQLAPPHVANIQPALDLNTAHSSHTLLQSNIGSPGAVAPRFSYAPPERVRHNHTYSAPMPAADQRPAHVRDKRVCVIINARLGGLYTGLPSVFEKNYEKSHFLSRDKKYLELDLCIFCCHPGIPLEVHDIINLPMDEFNERLSKHDLSEAQLSLIRDIRRRGKNKVAAQNCRKRKLDQITSLADEVKTVRDRKQRTQRDHHSLMAERQRVKERFAALYRHVFQNLRDPEGRPLSSNQFSLQQAADGNVVLVPKMPQHQDHPMNRTSDDEMDRKAKHYEQ
ncbi:hypothetical protein K1T71_015214 [Dendrolimus kikuchii]|nr:hypothetical protein K1T71_015214 [Dendrolimus kikuchii]